MNRLILQGLWVLVQPIFPLMILKVDEEWASGIDLLNPFFILLEVLYLIDALVFIYLFGNRKGK